jgi:hypothetical protein
MTAMTPTLAEQLNRALLADPAATRQQLQALQERARTDPYLQAGATRGLLLRPALLDDLEHERLVRDLSALQRLLLSLPDRLYDGDAGAMCETLGFPLVQRAAVEETWRDDAVLLSRTDLMRTTDGFKALEVNVHSSLGGLDSGPWHRAFLGVPVFADFIAGRRLGYVDPLDGVAGALHEAARRRGLGPFPCVAIVDWPTTYEKVEARLRRLAQLLSVRGFDAFACHAGQLAVRNDRLYAAGRRVDVLYRTFVIDQVSQHPPLLGPILAAHRAGSLVFAMTFLAELVGNKGVLALLSDPTHAAAYSEADRELVARLVPWTRFVRADVVRHAERAQQDLILKPIGGYGARGVVAGWRVDRTTWLDKVARSVDGPWILQQRVRAVPELSPVLDSDRLSLCEVDVNWGAFLVGDRYNGMMIRAVPTQENSMISTSSGAAIGACFVERPDPSGEARRGCGPV